MPWNEVIRISGSQSSVASVFSTERASASI
jgi:hypothetical protein